MRAMRPHAIYADRQTVKKPNSPLYILPIFYYIYGIENNFKKI